MMFLNHERTTRSAFSGYVSPTLGKKKISVVDLEERGKEFEIIEEKRKDM